MSKRRRARVSATAGAVLLLWACLAGVAACQRRPAASSPAEARAAGAAVTELVEKVRAKDFTATLRARELGPGAAAGVTPLLSDLDPTVRQLALLCLLEMPAPDALDIAFGAVSDDDPQVRAVALRGVGQLATRNHATRVVEALRNHPEPVARKELALIVGGMGGRESLGPLRAACDAHSDPETQRGCLVARAWLEDAEAQQEFGRQVVASRGGERIELLGYADRIRARWLLPSLGALLDDTGPARWIGADGRPGPETLRVCDVAVNLIAAISGHRFGFVVGPRVNYAPSEIAEVSRFVRSNP